MKQLHDLLIVICCAFLFTFNASAREVITIIKWKPIEEQFSKSNVEYRLRNNINLRGITLELPHNSVLNGKGRSLRNGTLVVSDGCEVKDICFKHSNVEMENVMGVHIFDCVFVGTLSLTDIKERNYTAAAIYGTGLKEICLETIKIQGYQWGISIVNSSDLSINNVTFVGIMNDPIDFERHIVNANYHDAVHISKSHTSNISNIYASNCGACVLLGGTSNKNVIEDCSGDGLWDNGVYISSGHNNIVQNCVFRNVRGSGVKVRGNCNVVTNNSVINVGTGYTVTGFGPASGIDELGMEYNGYGSIVNGNTVQNAKRYGVDIGMHGGLPFYRCSVTNNSIIDCAENSSAIGVICNYATITGNKVVCPESLGIVVIRNADKLSGGYKISENNIVCYRKGIVLQKCIDSVVSNNTVSAEEQGILVYATEGSSFILNKFLGKGKYFVSESKKGTSNNYRVFGDGDSLKPSEFVRLEK